MALSERGRTRSAPMRVFVSYTRKKDAFLAVSRFTERFERELRKSRPRAAVFMDKHNISPGQDFSQEIERELERCDVLLVLVSPAWLGSRWCRKEFRLFSRNRDAEGRHRPILPVLWVRTPELSESASDPIARQLAALQYADWHEERPKHWRNPSLRKRVAGFAKAAVHLLPEEDRLRSEGESELEMRLRAVEILAADLLGRSRGKQNLIARLRQRAGKHAIPGLQTPGMSDLFLSELEAIARQLKKPPSSGGGRNTRRTRRGRR